MNDSISRQVAIGAIDAHALTMYQNVKEGATYPKKEWFGGMAYACEIIKALPSAEPGWIPVSERLPEDKGRYLVWSNTIPCWPHHILNYDPETGDWFFDGFRSDECTINVLAWMPLPDPYHEAE